MKEGEGISPSVSVSVSVHTDCETMPKGKRASGEVGGGGNWDLCNRVNIKNEEKKVKQG